MSARDAAKSGGSVLTELRTLLEEVPEGRLSDELSGQVIEILEGRGFDLGVDEPEDGRFGPVGRATVVEWEPPHLSVRVYRLSGYWVDLDVWRFDLRWRRWRQFRMPLRPFREVQAPFDPAPVAEDLVRLMRERRRDARLQWTRKGRVRIRARVALPPAPRRTTQERRGRVEGLLARELEPEGWRRLRQGWWEPPDHFVTRPEVRKAVAEELVWAIAGGWEDSRLRWMGPKRVRIQMARIIRAEPRRSRDHWHEWLLEAMRRPLRMHGWDLGARRVWERTREADLGASVSVCGSCGSPAGASRLDGSLAQCRVCDPAAPDPARPVEITLCACCGESAMAYSSFLKWRGPSPNPYCDTCSDLVDAQNAELGRCAIPGTPAGDRLTFRRSEDTVDEVDSVITSVNFEAVRDARARIGEWSVEVRRRILRERFPDGLAWIPLGEWDRRLEDTTDNERRFREMLEFLAEGGRERGGRAAE